MKKLINVALLSMVAFMLFSCEPIEPEYKYEKFFDEIFTVNKHTVTPDFIDTTLMISNMDAYGFKTGDRVHMTVREYFDLSTMKKPVYEIANVTRKIPTFSLSQPGTIDSAEYNANFNKLIRYELADRYLNPVWVWKNRQNVSVSYFGIKEGASFAMVVRGVNKDCIEFDLYAKAQRDNNKTATELLTFDLSNVADFLTDEQKSSVARLDSLRTRIYLNHEDNNGVVKRAEIIGGKLANPIK